MEIADLDAFVLSQLSTEPLPARSLLTRFTSAHPEYGKRAARIIDRSLQRLRRTGQIALAPKQKGWVRVVTAEATP